MSDADKQEAQNKEAENKTTQNDEQGRKATHPNDATRQAERSEMSEIGAEAKGEGRIA